MTKATNVPQSSHVRVASVGNSSSGAVENEREAAAYDLRTQKSKFVENQATSKRLKMKSVESVSN